MYPGQVRNKIIPVFKTNDLCFKENDEKSSLPPVTSPFVNIHESNDAYLLTVASPGLHREDFQIVVEDAIINISAKMEPIQNNYKMDRCEYDYSGWTRAFRLPTNADAMLANAEYVNGELLIHIPIDGSNEKVENTKIHVY